MSTSESSSTSRSAASCSRKLRKLVRTKLRLGRQITVINDGYDTRAAIFMELIDESDGRRASRAAGFGVVFRQARRIPRPGDAWSCPRTHNRRFLPLLAYHRHQASFVVGYGG